MFLVVIVKAHKYLIFSLSSFLITSIYLSLIYVLGTLNSYYGTSFPLWIFFGLSAFEIIVYLAINNKKWLLLSIITILKGTSYTLVMSVFLFRGSSVLGTPELIFLIIGILLVLITVYIEYFGISRKLNSRSNEIIRSGIFKQKRLLILHIVYLIIIMLSIINDSFTFEGFVLSGGIFIGALFISITLTQYIISKNKGKKSSLTILTILKFLTILFVMIGLMMYVNISFYHPYTAIVNLLLHLVALVNFSFEMYLLNHQPLT